MDEVTCFSSDINTEVYNSCSLTWQNEFYIFGGHSRKRQISRVVGNKLTKVGTLSFDLYLGTGSVMGSNLIYLCFNYDSSDYRRCRVSEHPLEQFNEIQESVYEHALIQTAASDCKFIIFSIILNLSSSTTTSSWKL